MCVQEYLSQASAVCEKGSLKFQELIQTRLIKIKILSGRSDKDHESRAAVTAGVFNFYNTHSIYSDTDPRSSSGGGCHSSL
jgi:hypothetical protein